MSLQEQKKMKHLNKAVAWTFSLAIITAACSSPATVAPTAVPVQPTQPPAATQVVAPTAVPQTSADPALDSEYSQALLADAAQTVDTSAFAKPGPYTIAVSQQDPS